MREFKVLGRKNGEQNKYSKKQLGIEMRTVGSWAVFLSAACRCSFQCVTSQLAVLKDRSHVEQLS